MKRLLGAALFLAVLPVAAQAGTPLEDYVAARDAAVAALASAEKSGQSEEQLDALDERSRKALTPRLSAILGPLRFKGYDQGPLLSPAMLRAGSMGAGGPDGLFFANEDGSSDILVSPAPLFDTWLKARAKDEDAPDALKKGLPEATSADAFYTFAADKDAAFVRYVDLPVTAQPGEQIHAALGIFTQDVADGDTPDAMVLTRVADGRIYIATIAGSLEVPAIASCAQIWKTAESKAEALQKAAEKANKESDPRWEQVDEILTKGAADAHACFAQKVKDQPFYPDLVKQAEALAAITRGN